MRNPRDFYETPPHYVNALKDHIGEPDVIIEPCVGDGAITSQFPDSKRITNDIDPEKKAGTHFDATKEGYWQDFPKGWIITNPPFSCAYQILKHAYELTNNPIALCLRLSFLEPTRERRRFLFKHPPTGLIILPRYSFRVNDAGKRQTDSVTCAWMIWRLGVGIHVSPQQERK